MPQKIKINCIREICSLQFHPQDPSQRTRLVFVVVIDLISPISVWLTEVSDDDDVDVENNLVDSA